MQLSVTSDLAEVPAEAWDRLVPRSDPFTRHAFLHALETSGSVGEGTGWRPMHIQIHEDSVLVAAAPVYLKNHSYGEYIFDWGWAEACQRAEIPYYPKLVCAVPFTPATGRRLLVDPTLSSEKQIALQRMLLQGMRALADKVQAYSVHVLFCTEQEKSLNAPGFISRQTHQYHWDNPGVDDFTQWLGTFRSKDRKKARRERRYVEDLDVTLHWIPGAELRDEHIDAMRGFYHDTCSRKWGQTYLDPSFFDQLRQGLAPSAHVQLAYHKDRPVAGTLMFQAGDHLYGRYWGCDPAYSRLHFELCYHAPIERCIARGWSHFEAGAQGEHKIKRGLLPASTWSVHWLRHPGLAQAVEQAMEKEGAMTEHQLTALAKHGPFRRC